MSEREEVLSPHSHHLLIGARLFEKTSNFIIYTIVFVFFLVNIKIKGEKREKNSHIRLCGTSSFHKTILYFNFNFIVKLTPQLFLYTSQHSLLIDKMTLNNRNVIFFLIDKLFVLFLGSNVCFACGKEGHFARDCKYGRRRRSRYFSF